MKVYLFQLNRAKLFINVLIYVYIILKGYYALRKITVHTLRSSCHIKKKRILCAHIIYALIFILYIYIGLVSFALVVPLGDFVEFEFPKTFMVTDNSKSFPAVYHYCGFEVR